MITARALLRMRVPSGRSICAGCGPRRRWAALIGRSTIGCALCIWTRLCGNWTGCGRASRTPATSWRTWLGLRPAAGVCRLPEVWRRRLRRMARRAMPERFVPPPRPRCPKCPRLRRCVRCARAERERELLAFLAAADRAAGQRLPLSPGNFDSSFPAFHSPWRELEAEAARGKLAVAAGKLALMQRVQRSDEVPLCPCGFSEPSLVRMCRRVESATCRAPGERSRSGA